MSHWNTISDKVDGHTKNVCSHYYQAARRFIRIAQSAAALAAAISLLGLLGVAASTAAQALTAPYLDSNGWTVFTPSSDTNIVYVSSSTGNDSNSGLSISTPVKTIAHGLSLIRRGYPDWLLLKKGDTWTEGNYLHVSGRSSTEPMLISSYDPAQAGIPDPYGSTLARPLIKISSTLGAAGFATSGGGGAVLGDGNYIAFVGLELYASDRDPSSPDFNAANVGNSVSGISALLQVNWWLIEDCKIRFAAEAVGIDASLLGGAFDSNVTIRRNVIVDSYTINTNGGNGIHMDGVNNLVIEQNVIDHNGYQATLTASGQYQFNHNIYISAYMVEYDPTTISNPIVLSENILANDPSGSQLRTGGTITNNLWLRNPYVANIPLPTVFASQFANNVVLEAAGNVGQNFNWGIQTGDSPPNYGAGTIAVANNIFAHVYTNSSNADVLDFAGTASSGSLSNNIVYDWVASATLWNFPAGLPATGNVLDVAGTNSEGYPDPTRSVGSYSATLGLPATTDGFLAAARLQSKDNWNPALMAGSVNDYIRAGFGIGSTGAPPPSAPTADTTPPSVPTALAGTVATATQVNLSWTASTDNVGVAGYKIFRNGTQLGTTASTSYSDTGLSAATTYTYTVAAYDAAGNTSTQSSGVTVTTPAPAPSLTIALTSPTNGATIHGNGSVNIASNASDSTSIKTITIKSDSNVLSTCASATSCTATWQGKNISKGTHVISATAVDAFGSTSSVSVSILALK